MEGNFPIISKPDEWDVCLTDVKFDLKDTNRPVQIDECKDEYNFWWNME
jgi:hypothetical protein